MTAMIYHIPSACYRHSGARLASKQISVYKIWVGERNSAMLDLYPLIRPLLGGLPAEAAHEVAIRVLEAGLPGWLAGNAAREP
jgi:hypothetical protein